MKLRNYYSYEEINNNAKGIFGELVAIQALRDAGCKVYKLERDFVRLISAEDIPSFVKEAVELCRDKEIKIYYAKREWTLEEILKEPTISEEEKKRLINLAEVKLRKGTPDLLVYDPSHPLERNRWNFVEVKFGYSQLTTEQRMILRILSHYLPCYVMRVVLDSEGAHIFMETIHLGESYESGESVGGNISKVNESVGSATTEISEKKTDSK